MNRLSILLAVGMGVQTGLAQQKIRELASERGRYVGTAVNAAFYNANPSPAHYKDTLKTQFNVLVAENEMKMDALQPSQGNFNWTRSDALIRFAEENQMRVRGHALVWHSQIPGWVRNGSWTRQTLLAVMKDHIETVVTKYKGRVHEWDVVNEAVTDGNPATHRNQDNGSNQDGSIWYRVIGADYIDSAFVWAHRADPDAELYYNDYNIEYGGSKNTFIRNMVKSMKDKGIPITGVGMQAHLEYNLGSSRIQVISDFVDFLAQNNLKGAITELDLGIPAGTANQAALITQAHSYSLMMDVFLKKNNMTTFVMWGFTDAYTWLTAPQFNDEQPLIYDAQLRHKPAYDSLIAAMKRYPATGISSSSRTTTGSSSSTASSSSQAAIPTPYGAGTHLPGLLLAVNYDLGGPGVAYFDSDEINEGDAYRDDGVDIGGSDETGYVVGWTSTGEWLKYTVEVDSSGSYSLEFSIASEMDGARLHLQVDGTDVTGPLEVPNTGGWNDYQTISAAATLPQGPHVLTLFVDAASFNIASIRFVRTGPGDASGVFNVNSEIYNPETRATSLFRLSNGIGVHFSGATGIYNVNGRKQSRF